MVFPNVPLQQSFSKRLVMEAIFQSPHIRTNLLTGEQVLVSPQRNLRPWQGKTEAMTEEHRPAHDPHCYLCPGNTRAGGHQNPPYEAPWAFVNDFSALLADTPPGSLQIQDMLKAESLSGICKVICFSPRHDLTLSQMSVPQIRSVVDLWVAEFDELAALPEIRYIQIFENKGEIMGCSNPHPHGQIWSQSILPVEIRKETEHQAEYFFRTGRSLLADYIALEERQQERLVYANAHFVAVVPFWAVWPYETLLVSRRPVADIRAFAPEERAALAEALQALTIRYDNLFQVSFPYSAGMHQAPVNMGEQPGWHWHMHFYPPLLRSATIKKFMVGYEMLAGPQRDITPEQAAEALRSLPAERSF